MYLLQVPLVDSIDWSSLLQQSWAKIVEVLSSKCVVYPFIAWAISFTVLMVLLLCLGFGPAGVVAGSMAAAFQAFMYGAFTPAAGLFATLTSLAMLGLLMPIAAVVFALVALIPAWFYIPAECF